MDIEKPIRKQLIDILKPFFDCFEEVDVVAVDKSKRRVDVLAVSSTDTLTPVVLGFEVKSHDNSDPGKLKDAVWQAHRYVGASFENVFNPFGKNEIDLAVVFPAPSYRWISQPRETDGREHILSGIQFLAERLNVGFMRRRLKHHEICFGPGEFWNSRDGWKYDSRQRLKEHHIGCDPFVNIDE